MVKSRFSATDVAAMVASIRPHILGARIANVYDIGGKLFLMKFSSSLIEDEEGAAGKATLLIEAGVRFHLTTFERKKSAIPSGWTMNLRKLLRGKLLERFDQAGTDRVVVMQFGINDKAVHVVIELYAKGNIVVTDSNFKVQLLLRSHTFDSGSVVARNEVYPIDSCASVVTPVRSDWQTDPEILSLMDEINVEEFLSVAAAAAATTNGSTNSRRKKKQSENAVLGKVERLLMKIIPFSHSSLIQLTLKSAIEWDEKPSIIQILDKAVCFALSVLDQAKSINSDEGYIGRCGGKVVDFAPIQVLLDPSTDVERVGSFSAAVDDFFSAIETSGEADKVDAQRAALLSKVENIKADQQRRIEELIAEQECLWHQAELLEANLDIADAAITILNALISKQLSWAEISETVAAQGKAGHPVASRIGKIDFNRNRFQMRIIEDENVNVWLDLSLGGTQNVSALHAMRKHHKEKLAKTQDQAAAAIKAAEQKLRSDLSKFDDSVERDRHLAKVRRRFWFEKFYWFITSEGFLVIAGRDATQNEAIYKKYLKNRDVYVHADIHGAATVVVKNHLPETGTIPALSLAEAGQFSLCHSSAWSSKIVTSAWWVRADQVSKTAPTGEYLTTGSFMIRGKKKFLPPSRLELGIGVLFYVSEDTAKSRGPERVVRSTGDAAVDDVPSHAATDEPTGVVSIVTTGERLVPKQKQIKIPKKSEVIVAAKPEPPVAILPVTTPPVGKKSSSKSKKNIAKKEKYVFNDELQDERIRQKLLGIKISHDPSSIAQDNADNLEEAQVAATSRPSIKACYVCGSEEHLASDCPSKQQQTTQMEAPVLDDDEGPPTGEGQVLDRLVGSVRDDDELIHAVPMCGPYSALNTCTLKAKIVPGSTKRGKAAKLLTQMFGGGPSASVKKLVKLIPVEEFSECLVNDVKVTGAGVTKLQVETKKAKKNAHKTKK